MEQADFYNAGTNSGKLKIASMIIWVGVVKNGHDLLVYKTIKSALL